MLRSNSGRLTPPRGRASARAAALTFAALIAAATQLPALAGSAGVGATPSPSPSSSALPEIGRVFASDRHGESTAQTTRPTYIVTRAQIDARGDKTVSDALQSVPGIDLFSYGAFGAEVDYGIRGAGSSSRTLVLLNGVPIENESSQSVDISQLSTVAVDRIEVVESGSSTLYGTNASGGVINIVTRPEKGADGSISDSSYGDRDLRLALGNGTVGFSYERHVATNDYPYEAFLYTDPKSPTFPAGYRAGAFANESEGRIDLATSVAGLDVRGSAGLAGVQFGVPGGLNFAQIGDSQDTNRGDAQVTLSHTAGANTASVTFAGAKESFAYHDPVDGGGESDTSDGRTQISVEDVLRGHAGTAVAGIDLSRESAFLTVPTYGAAGAIPNFGASESQSAAYLQTTANVSTFASIEGGLRAESDSRLGQAGSGERDRLIDPSVGFTAHTGGVKFMANYGESFRVPSLIDLYYPGYSNPKLRPERSTNLDGTISYDAASGAGLSAGYFETTAANYIVFSDTLNIPLNDEHASIAGLTLGFHAPLSNGVRATLDFTDTYRAIDLDDGSRLPRTPLVTAIFGLEKPFATQRVAYGIRARIVGTDFDNGPAPVGSTYDAYTNVDGYVRYRLAPQAIVTARVFNAGNAQYAPIYGYPAPGRTFALELSTR